MKKILWVDYEDRFYFFEGITKLLARRGFEVKQIPWFNEITRQWDIDRVIELSKDFDFLFMHYGSEKTREEAAAILNKIKAGTKIKIIVNTVSPILLERADATVGTPFFTDELIEILNNLSTKGPS